MLGARIAVLRRAKGWNQSDLAKQLGVSSSAVGMYEQGRREPSLSPLWALFGPSCALGTGIRRDDRLPTYGRNTGF